MTHRLFLFALIPLLGFSFPLGNNPTHEAYIEQYKDIAIAEMNRKGIPASIKLAQAILESNGGKSELATRANNHFGIKCGGNWNGPTYELHDDDKNDRGELIHSCFRAYRHAKASFEAHSDFLSDSDKYGRYGFLFEYDPDDYRNWAFGLQKAGYATNPRYARQLIDLIERYELHQYDQFGAYGKDRLASVSLLNDLRVVFAGEGETLEKISARTEVSVSKLLKYNEETYKPYELIAKGCPVFLQPKRNSYRGKQKWHKVAKGETMAQMAQNYGIKTHKLRRLNRMHYLYEPQPGEKISLRGRVSKKNAPLTRPLDPDPDFIFPAPEPEFLPELVSAPEASLETTLSNPPRKGPNPPAVNPIPSPGVKEKTPAPKSHTVKPGETLWRIATLYGIPVQTLKSKNNLSSDLISVGQILVIP